VRSVPLFAQGNPLGLAPRGGRGSGRLRYGVDVALAPQDRGDGTSTPSGWGGVGNNDLLAMRLALNRDGASRADGLYPLTAAKRLQSGRLDAYLLYMLIALIAIIAVAAALA